MAIKGSLKEAGLPDVIQLLSMGQKTGILTVTERDHFGSITFSKGDIVDSYLINRKNRIGELLVASGEMSREQLSRALEIQKQTGEKIGMILLKEKYIREDVLKKNLRQQIKETIFTMMRWEDGYFNFEPRYSVSDEKILAINPETLLLETARQVDEISEVSLDIIRDSSVLKVVGSEEEVSRLSGREKKVYSLLDGEIPLQIIIESSPFDKFETKEILSSLVNRGICTVVEEVSQKTLSQKISEHLNLGIAFLKTNLYDEAEREFKHILKIDHSNEEARFYLSVILTKTKNYKEAEDLLRKLLKGHPDNLLYENNLGYVLEMKEEEEEALKLFNKAATSESSGIPFLNIGIIYFNREEYQKSKELLSKAKEMDDSMILPHFYLALIDVVSGRLKQAVSRIRGIIKKEPELAILYYNLGVIQEEIGKREEAEINYKKALNLTPNNIKPRIKLGELYYKRGRYPSARAAFEMVTDAGLGDAGIFLKLGNIYYKLGEKNKAISAWRKSLELDPSSSIARKNIEMAEQ
jgi:tetratricopeptide (TPR) repeat protein